MFRMRLMVDLCTSKVFRLRPERRAIKNDRLSNRSHCLSLFSNSHFYSDSQHSQRHSFTQLQLQF